MSTKTVTRCVCHDRQFTELKQIAFVKKIRSVDEFMALRISSCGCGLCRPYISKMLRTGETSFAPGDVDPEDT